MRKFKKTLYVLVAFAMILQLAPMIGGVTAVAETGDENRIVLTAAADTTTLPHVPGVWANGANATFSVVGYNARNFVRFDAADHVDRRGELERATLRLHFYRMGNPAAALPQSWPHFLPVYIWDPWPESGVLWQETTLGWQNLWGGATPNGNSIWRHLQSTAPEDALAAAPLYSPTAWANQGMAWHPQGHNGQGAPAFAQPDRDRLPLTATNAFLYQEREPGSIITGFLVDKVPDKWFEIDITDYVLSSMLPSGERDLNSLTGTGWGRDGVVNLGFNGGPAHQTAPGGAAVLEMLFSTRERLGGAFAPELVLEFRDDNAHYIEKSVTANMSAQVMNTRDFANFGRPPDSVIDNDNLAVWSGGSPDDGSQMYGNSFVQFDVSELKLAPTGYRISEAWLRLRTVGVDGSELGNLAYWNRHVLLQIRPRTVAVSLVSDHWDENMTPENRPPLNLGEHPGILSTIYRTVTPVNMINSTQYVDVTQAFDLLGYGGVMDVLSFRLHTHGSGPQFWTEFAGINYSNEEFRPTLIVRYVECDLNAVIYDRQPITVGLGDLGIVDFGTPWSEVLTMLNAQIPTVMVTYHERGGAGVRVFEYNIDWAAFDAGWDPTDSGTLHTTTGRIGTLVNPSEAAGLDLRDSGATRVTATVTADTDVTPLPPAMPDYHPGIVRTTLPVLADTFALGWNAAWNGGASQYMTIRHEHAAFIRFDASDYVDYRGAIERAVVRMYINPPAWPYNVNPAVDGRNTWMFPVVSMVMIDPWPAGSRPGDPGVIWQESGPDALIGNTVNPASGLRQVAYGLKSPVPNGMMFTETLNRLADRERGSFVSIYGIAQGYGNRWVEVDVTDYVISSMNPAGTREAAPLAGTGWGRDGIINIGIKNHMLSTGGQGVSAFNIATRESGRGAELIITFAPDEAELGTEINEIPLNPVEAGALVINQREAGWQNTQGTNVDTVLPVRDGGFATLGNTTNPAGVELNLSESYLKFDVSEIANIPLDDIYDVRLRLTVESARGRDNQPRMAIVSVAGDNWTSGNLSWANRPKLADVAAPDNVGFILNAQVGETVYVDVTPALNFLDAGGVNDYLTLRIAHTGRAQNWPNNTEAGLGHYMGTNFHGVNAAENLRPQLIVREFSEQEDAYFDRQEPALLEGLNTWVGAEWSDVLTALEAQRSTASIPYAERGNASNTRNFVYNIEWPAALGTWDNEAAVGAVINVTGTIGSRVSNVPGHITPENPDDFETVTIPITIVDLPPAPTGVVGHNYITGGRITGVTSAMEFSADNGVTWTNVTGVQITGLDSGTYLVRYRADGDTPASLAVAITITAPDGFTFFGLSENGMIAEIAGNNNSDAPIAAMLIASLFDTNGRLMQTVVHSVAIPAVAGENWSQPITIVGNGTGQLPHTPGATVRALLWDGINTMQPILPAVEPVTLPTL